jgi:apolipoprotein N-acyltransferase
MVWVSAALARAILEGPRRAAASLAAASVAAGAIFVFGLLRISAIERQIAAAEPVRVALVQGNLGIKEKGNVRYFESNVATYRALTLEVADRADVVIWPETVIGEPLPRTLERLPRGAAETLGLRKPLLTGALTYEGSPQRPRFFNSVVLFGREGEVLGVSDKQILMPFGEYMPFGSVFPLLKALSPQTGDFEAGSGVVVLDVPGAGRFAPLNCYEDLRASISRQAVWQDHAEVLFAVANDAWFGDTIAPFQHEALALWRAVENRRFLVRVTNTGVTDVIDPLGRVVVRLPVFVAESRVAEIRRLKVPTFYQRFGDAFAWLVTAIALLAVARGRRR